MSKFRVLNRILLLAVLGLGLACSESPEQYQTGNAPEGLDTPEVPVGLGPSVLSQSATIANQDEIIKRNSQKPIIYNKDNPELSGAAGINLMTPLKKADQTLSRPLAVRSNGIRFYSENLVVLWRTQEPKVPVFMSAINGYLGVLKVSDNFSIKLGETSLQDFFGEGDELGDKGAVSRFYNLINQKSDDYDCLKTRKCRAVLSRNNFIIWDLDHLWFFMSRDRKVVFEARFYYKVDLGVLGNSVDLASLSLIGRENGGQKELLGLGISNEASKKILNETKRVSRGSNSFSKSFGDIGVGFTRSRYERDYNLPDPTETLNAIFFGMGYKTPLMLNKKYIVLSQTQTDQGAKVELRTSDQLIKGMTKWEVLHTDRVKAGEVNQVLVHDQTANRYTVYDATGQSALGSYRFKKFKVQDAPLNAEQVVSSVEVFDSKGDLTKTLNRVLKFAVDQDGKLVKKNGQLVPVSARVEQIERDQVSVLPKTNLFYRAPFDQILLPRGTRKLVKQEKVLTHGIEIPNKKIQLSMMEQLVALVAAEYGTRNPDAQVATRINGAFSRDNSGSLEGIVYGIDTKNQVVERVEMALNRKNGALTSTYIESNKNPISTLAYSQAMTPTLLPLFETREQFASPSAYAKSLGAFTIGEVVTLEEIDKERSEATLVLNRPGTEEIRTRVNYSPDTRYEAIYEKDEKRVDGGVATSIGVTEAGTNLLLACVDCQKADKKTYKVFEIITSTLFEKISGVCGLKGQDLSLAIGMQATVVKRKLDRAVENAQKNLRGYHCNYVVAKSTDGNNRISSITFPQQRVQLLFSEGELSTVSVYTNPKELPNTQNEVR
jgi:hypothetical protein